MLALQAPSGGCRFAGGLRNRRRCRSRVLNESPQTARPADLDRLEIAGLTLDLRREELRDAAGTLIELRNRSFGVLRYLATNAGRLVTKDELLGANWPGVTVSEDSLTQCISEIRRVLGDAGRNLIRTMPRRGYMIAYPERPSQLPVTGAGGPAVAVLPFENNTGDVREDVLA